MRKKRKESESECAMSTPHENAPQEAQNIIVMENNIINYDPNYVGSGMIIGPTSTPTAAATTTATATNKTIKSRVQTHKVTSTGGGGGIKSPRMQNLNMKGVAVNAGGATTTTTVRSPKNQNYTTQTVYSTSPQSTMQMQKITMPRNVQVVSKTVGASGGNTSMIVCQPSSRVGHLGGQPQIHQIIETSHPSQSPSHQQQQFHESNTTTTYVPSATTTTTVKTIYMNNNTGNLNLNKSTNKINISPLDYTSSASVDKVIGKYSTTTTRIQSVSSSSAAAASPADSQQVNIDGGKYAFKYSTTGQQQGGGCNIITTNNKTTKSFNNNCNIKNVQQQQQTQQQAQQTSYYYQPQIKYATTTQGGAGSGGGAVVAASNTTKNQQYVHVHQRLPVNNYVHATLQSSNAKVGGGGGGTNATTTTTNNRNKYIIQGATGEIVNQNVQQIRYTTKNDAGKETLWIIF